MPPSFLRGFLLIKINLFPAGGDHFTGLPVYWATLKLQHPNPSSRKTESGRMRQAISFATFIAFLACVSLTSIAQDTPPPQQHRAMPAPTNLQVLPKDIAPQDLMKMMFGFSQALGVQCNFCHEVNEQTHQPNFAADTKPEKASARTMIAMTQEINSKFMTQIKDPDATPADKTVTCGTCHRGDHMPAPFVPKPEGGGTPKPQ
jgi:Photosynthetic reaction centre cytochrome C subunit